MLLYDREKKIQSRLICRCFWNECYWACKRERERETWVSHEVPPLSAADSLTFCSLLLGCERRGSARNGSQSHRGAAAGREYYNGVQFWQREGLFPHYAKTLAAFQTHSKDSFRGEPRRAEARASNEEACRLHCAGCSFFSLSVWKLSWAVSVSSAVVYRTSTQTISLRFCLFVKNKYF